MNEKKPSHGPHGDPNGGSSHPIHRPYWRRAHRDWRIWVCGVIMLVALLLYLTDYEMPWWPRHRPPLL